MAFERQKFLASNDVDSPTISSKWQVASPAAIPAACAKLLPVFPTSIFNFTAFSLQASSKHSLVASAVALVGERIDAIVINDSPW